MRELRRFVNVVNGQMEGARTKDYLHVHCQRTGKIRHNNMVSNTTTPGLSQTESHCCALLPAFRAMGQSVFAGQSSENMLWALSNKWANLFPCKLALTKLRRRFVLLDSNPGCRTKAGEVVGTVSRALPPRPPRPTHAICEHATMTQAQCSVNCQTFAKHIITEETAIWENRQDELLFGRSAKC